MPAIKTAVKKAAKKPAPKAAKKVTIDDVWATIDSIGKAHTETEKAHKETEKAQKEMQETLKETQRIVGDLGNKFGDMQETLKETQRIVGDLGNKFGDIAEQMLTPALVEKFEKLTFPFTIISRNIKRKSKELGLSMELDALLENGTKAMVVEVKSKLKKDYVDDFVEQMETVRRFADFDGNARQFYGAMGAMTADEKTIKYALDKGFYIIMPSGEDVKITEPASQKVW